MPEDLQQRHDGKSLRMIKIALVFILLCLCVMGRERRAWPIKHWTMYSLRTFNYPSDTVSSYKLRVISHSGNLYTLASWDLIPMDRHVVAKEVIKHSIDGTSLKKRDRYRAYLVRLVNQALLGVPLKTIQVWESSWKVDPLALPPLDLKNPFTEVMKDSFSVALKTGTRGDAQ